jgi:hypothetical protein
MGETPPTRIDRMVTDYYDRASEEARLEQALLVEQDLRDGQHRNPTERLGALRRVRFERARCGKSVVWRILVGGCKSLPLR